MVFIRINEYVCVVVHESSFSIVLEYPYQGKIYCSKSDYINYYVMVSVSKREILVNTPYHLAEKIIEIEHAFYGKEAKKRYEAVRENLKRILKNLKKVVEE